MSTIVGDNNGISLWNKMTASVDAEEVSFVNSLNEAAQKYGKIYFYDCVRQRQSRKNEAKYCMEWNGLNWNVNLFLLPEGATVVNYNPPPPVVALTEDESLWHEIDPNDIIIIEEEPA